MLGVRGQVARICHFSQRRSSTNFQSQPTHSPGRSRLHGGSQMWWPLNHDVGRGLWRPVTEFGWELGDANVSALGVLTAKHSGAPAPFCRVSADALAVPDVEHDGNRTCSRGQASAQTQCLSQDKPYV